MNKLMLVVITMSLGIGLVGIICLGYVFREHVRKGGYPSIWRWLFGRGDTSEPTMSQILSSVLRQGPSIQRYYMIDHLRSLTIAIDQGNIQQMRELWYMYQVWLSYTLEWCEVNPDYMDFVALEQLHSQGIAIKIDLDDIAYIDRVDFLEVICEHFLALVAGPIDLYDELDDDTLKEVAVKVLERMIGYTPGFYWIFFKTAPYLGGTRLREVIHDLSLADFLPITLPKQSSDYEILDDTYEVGGNTFNIPGSFYA